MLLCRFPTKVVPNKAAKAGEEIPIVISMYRQNVDTSYQRMVMKRIDDGHLDQYIKMIISSMLYTGKYPLFC